MIPGIVGLEELKELAKKNGGVIKYYVVSRAAQKIVVRYLDANGYWTDSPGSSRAEKAYDLVDRFANYWHAYAYQLHLTKKEVPTI